MAADIVKDTWFRPLVYPNFSKLSLGYTESRNHFCNLMSCWLLPLLLILLRHNLPYSTYCYLDWWLLCVLRHCVFYITTAAILQGYSKPWAHVLSLTSTAGVVTTSSTTITTNWHACRLCWDMVSTPGVPQALAGELGVHPKSKPLLHYSAAAYYLVEP